MNNFSPCRSSEKCISPSFFTFAGVLKKQHAVVVCCVLAKQLSKTPTTQLVPILRESLVNAFNPAAGDAIAQVGHNPEIIRTSTSSCVE
jgi:hypothetical protein